MIGRRSNALSSSTPIRADVHARFLDALRRVTEQEKADAAAQRRALAKAAAATANDPTRSGRRTRGPGIRVGSARRGAAIAS
jgi:hypothetical protein